MLGQSLEWNDGDGHSDGWNRTWQHDTWSMEQNILKSKNKIENNF
jgi:hypothetical protein